jgi:hypothetical protein
MVGMILSGDEQSSSNDGKKCRKFINGQRSQFFIDPTYFENII